VSQLRRKITFQLVPLLDLMLIVIFAQLMEARQLTERDSSRAVQALEQSRAATETSLHEQQRVSEIAADLARERKQAVGLQAELTRLQVDSAARLSEARAERDRIAALAADLFQIPDELLRKVIQARSPDELARVRKLLSGFPSANDPDVVKQLLTVDRLRKTCEVWDIHIDANSIVRLSNRRDNGSFRADSPTEFEKEFFEWYRRLPPAKSVIIITLSWSDATAQARESARIGLRQTIEKLHSDGQGRTLFEYVEVGFKPD
jgi:hypothetical protein